MAPKIKFTDTGGDTHSYPCRVLDRKTRYALDSKEILLDLGESVRFSTYTGNIPYMENEVPGVVCLLKNGKIVEARYFSRMDRDFVVREAI